MFSKLQKSCRTMSPLSLNHLRISCRHVPLPPEYFGMFSYQPGVTLRSHGMAINIRKLPLILSIHCCLSHRTGLISASCPRDVLCSKKFNLESCVTLSPCIPLSLLQFGTIRQTFLDFYNLDTFED